jgi:hypothetical protein
MALTNHKDVQFNYGHCYSVSTLVSLRLSPHAYASGGDEEDMRYKHLNKHDPLAEDDNLRSTPMHMQCPKNSLTILSAGRAA